MVLFTDFYGILGIFSCLFKLIHSVSSIGKKFLLMYYCALISSLLAALMGIIEMVQSFITDSFTDDNKWLVLLNLLKIGLFANVSLFSYLGCLFLQFNDDIDDPDK